MQRSRVSSRSHEEGNPYTIEWVRFPSGERLPLLVCRTTGLPIEAPTYWIAATERPLNKAAATLEKQLRHLMLLYLWADCRGRTPEELIRSPGFLTLEELNDLDRFCRLQLSEAIAAARAVAGASTSVIPIRKRKRNGVVGLHVPTDVGHRLSVIHSFLDHVSFSHASRMEPGGTNRSIYEQSRKFVLGALYERARSFRPRRIAGESREGLEIAAREALLGAIKQGQSANPWEPQVQKRNELIIRLLYELGLRRGEVLCLRVSDIKLTPDGGVLTVVRRPQDPEDPRQPKPQVKTLGRELPLGLTLRELFLDYLAERRRLAGARRHPFAFVSSVDGSPLSCWSMTKIFKTLRTAKGVPGDLTAHVLRHDWNDRFSEMSDRASPHRTSVDATKEERARAYAMGWSNFDTAANYTRRWTREAANRRVLKMQEQREIFERDAIGYSDQSTHSEGEV